MRDGTDDLRGTAAELAERLPEPLAPLARIAYNYRWSWHPHGPALLRSLDPERFALCAQNPVRLLEEASPWRLSRAAQDRQLVARAAALDAEIAGELLQPTPTDPVAFVCAEYAVHVSLPIYSGGLGALAGDLLKQASDRRLPMVAVGLMYRKGYFRQRIDASGWQHEYWVETDPERLPAALVTGDGGTPLLIHVPIGGTQVAARIWRVQVGRVPLFLLDTDFEANEPLARWITGRLYDADPETRLAQYALLGPGGIRALRAMGIEPSVVHLNEGHAALASLELARTGGGLDVERAGSRTVFTTHTPVAAGNDCYTPEQIETVIGGLASELGCDIPQLIGLGRVHPEDPAEPFGVTQAALRMSRAANAVSRRHGEVAREMWHGLWPERPVEEVPIGHITNGVHIPTWIGAPMRELLERHLGADWLKNVPDAHTWAAVDSIPDAELWEARRRQRTRLIELVRERSTTDRLARGDLREYALAAAQAFDPETLTIGFARRVATYKRLELLTRDPDWTMALLGGNRPVQILLAGKAHPRDEEAKRSLQRLFGLKYAQIIAQRAVFLDDYDLASAALLVRGCDVWLNLPRPPLEASGTSGMKSAVNGGLQLSVLDGWWAEGYDGGNGWALPGEVEGDPEAQDQRDADLLHQMLAEQVVPLFYGRDDEGLPRGWLDMIRRSLRSIAPRYSAARMLDEYVGRMYSAGRPDLVRASLT